MIPKPLDKQKKKSQRFLIQRCQTQTVDWLGALQKSTQPRGATEDKIPSRDPPATLSIVAWNGSHAIKGQICTFSNLYKGIRRPFAILTNMV